MISPKELMSEAIAVCREGLAAGQSPFGCAIAVEGKLVARAHNTVMLSTDITAHAEVNAIRAANQTLGEVFLTGAAVATTCEPCPMCLAALHWARVETIYIGASIADAEAAGFNELDIPAAEMVKIGRSPMKLVDNTRREECRDLFQEWLANPNRQPY